MIDYGRRINARETKAAILEMIPSLNLQVGGNYNSNAFLFNQNWAAYAARASWNLLNIFRYPARAKTIEAQDQVLHTQTLALTMAIMSQVHVSVAQWHKRRKKPRRRSSITRHSLKFPSRLASAGGSGGRANRRCCASESIRWRRNCDTMP